MYYRVMRTGRGCSSRLRERDPLREVKYWSRIYGLNRGLYSHLTKIKMVFNIAPFDPMRFHIRTGFNENGGYLNCLCR